MSRRLDPSLVLYYAWLPTLTLMAVGTSLFLSKSIIAAASEALIGVVLLGEGLAFFTDFRGYASAAIHEYKREPASYLVRAASGWILRFGSSSLFVWMGAMYFWVAVRTLS